MIAGKAFAGTDFPGFICKTCGWVLLDYQNDTPRFYSPVCRENEKSRSKRYRACSDVARLAGFEPATYRFVAGHSIH